MKISVENINNNIGVNAQDFLLKSNNDFEKQIELIADTIRENAQKTPIILLSGPSGSGKTTSALMIEKILDNSGFETHTISMDNYFKPMTASEQVLAANKKLDLESPERVDTELLNEQIQKLIACEEIDIPKYDFHACKRVNGNRKLKRKPNELIIFEGIHALNPDVITVDESQTYGIYVSVRTRIETKDGFCVHPKRVRLLRRMIRDKMFRNREVANTYKMFESVQRGENLYIMPYKNRASVQVNTFFPYEVSVYKPFIEDDLKTLSDKKDVAELIKVLDELKPINKSLVPKSSLITEFIGNGQFKY